MKKKKKDVKSMFSKYKLEDGTEILHTWKECKGEIFDETKLKKISDTLYEVFEENKTLKMRNEKYKIIKNECGYDLEVTQENVLNFKRGDELYISIHLDRVCLGSKKRILKHLGIEIKRED